MACRSFRDIAAEQAARKLALAGRPNATQAQRIAAFEARTRARDAADSKLSDGDKMLRDAVGSDAHRNR